MNRKFQTHMYIATLQSKFFITKVTGSLTMFGGQARGPSQINAITNCESGC